MVEELTYIIITQLCFISIIFLPNIWHGAIRSNSTSFNNSWAFMMSPIKEIDLEDFTEAIPAFLTIVMMSLPIVAEGIDLAWFPMYYLSL